MPLVLARADGSAVAVCHAGWKGLAAGRDRGDAPTRSARRRWPRPSGRAPGRSATRCELDVAGPLRERFGDDVVRDGCADLPLCAERALRAAGVAEIDVAGLCTIADAERFFSHRRDGAPGGRQAVIAYREAA